MRVVLRTVNASVDFVHVDRTTACTTVVTMREGMPTRWAFLCARLLLTEDERIAARASFGGPALTDCGSELDVMLPFVSASWLDPARVGL